MNRKIILLLLFVGVILPFGGINVLNLEFYKLNISEYYFIFFSILTLLFASKFSLKDILFFSISLFLVLIYLSIYMSNNFDMSILKVYFFICLFLAIFFLTEINLDIDKIYILFIASVFFDLIMWSVLNLGYIQPEGIRREFYLRGNMYRYSDLSMLLQQFLSLFFLFKTRYNLKKNIFIFFISLILVVITQDRIYLLFVFLSMFLYRPFLSSSFFIIASIIAFFYHGSIHFSREAVLRYQSLINPDIFISEMLRRFVDPVGDIQFSLSNILFGNGIQYRFYIPWYEYRGLNPYHFSVDSFFVTTFIKHGFVGLVLFFSIFASVFMRFGFIFFFWLVTYLIFHNGLYLIDFLFMLFFVKQLSLKEV